MEEFDLIAALKDLNSAKTMLIAELDKDVQSNASIQFWRERIQEREKEFNRANRIFNNKHKKLRAEVFQHN